ncbi:uncharacterized protein DUF4242 [Haloactinopolyspora alba]|uniref:Uncharacterized protein DUF4242 n=1 Tax=Haloactinopolyspora alba TaxID=648780 RepID=A0A2P8DVS3_9ACTN|nr:nickel-binding protein [Haloactinopolyspora alba]PSL01305.1 uncharacterized protein DUF4242 [Haloactinopolyspora alba]
MPLFMDVHHSIPEGADAAAVASAHLADLRIQDKYHARYLNYWLDPTAGKIFCLVDAPDAESAHAVHREAHGLVADEIFPVVQG